MNTRLYSRWARLLRNAAALTLDGAQPGELDAAGDELGHRRLVDGPFLAWRRREAAPASSVTPGEGLDIEIWNALRSGSPSADLVGRLVGAQSPAPLTPETDGATIEVWTERELAALHGAWRLARRLGREDLAQRCLLAADWHVERLQPDNATNRPWALHVFVIGAAQRISAEHELYAQMLLHNCQIMFGRPDRISAHILLDSAECLEAELSEPALA